MAVIGPELPPHLISKRKRDSDKIDRSQSSEQSNEEESNAEPEASKKRRVVGPALPPAPLDQRPAPDPYQSDSSSGGDDDYGPVLPSTADDTNREAEQVVLAFDEVAKEPPDQERPTKRDEWMMLPPKQDDLSARMDPTKLRARGFNTSKSAKAPKAGASDTAAWAETPEQKRKRLQDEVLGIKPASAEDTADHWKERAKRLRDEEKAKQIREHNAQTRNHSLYTQHKRTSDKEEEDDPSKRGFNYERDMSAAPKINHAQKREMLNKAADFGSRFSKGSYL